MDESDIDELAADPPLSTALELPTGAPGPVPIPTAAVVDVDRYCELSEELDKVQDETTAAVQTDSVNCESCHR